jgi:hypothetical protein
MSWLQRRGEMTEGACATEASPFQGQRPLGSYSSDPLGLLSTCRFHKTTLVQDVIQILHSLAGEQVLNRMDVILSYLPPHEGLLPKWLLFVSFL